MRIAIDPALLTGFALALVRATAWAVACPPFNSDWLPRRARVGLAAAMALVLAGPASEVAPSLSTGGFIGALLVQALAGLAFGWIVGALFAAVQAAGAFIDLQVGTSAGAVFDPFSGNGAAPIGRFHQLVAMAILFATNGHVLITRGFLRSVEAIPMGNISFDRLAEVAVEALVTMFAAAIEIGLPVLAALFCAEIALGLLGKAAPQLNILVIGYAVKTVAAFALLGTTLVLMPESVGSLVEQALRFAERIYSG